MTPPPSSIPAATIYTTKGILLTNLNFNALGQQIIATNPMFRPGDRMRLCHAAVPRLRSRRVHPFHVSQGGRCVLVPRFTAQSYSSSSPSTAAISSPASPRCMKRLLRLPNMDKADLSCLKGVFSGGDSLSIELKKKFDKFLYDHHATVQVREGYALPRPSPPAA